MSVHIELANKILLFFGRKVLKKQFFGNADELLMRVIGRSFIPVLAPVDLPHSLIALIVFTVPVVI